MPTHPPGLTPAEIQAEQDRLETFPLNAGAPRLANSVTISGNGRLFGFAVHNTNASAQYICMFDANVIPADAAVPLMAFKVAGNDNLYLQWIPGRTFREGIVLCNSSTDTAKTIGAADCLFDVQYI